MKPKFDEAEAKATKNKVFSKLLREFSLGIGDLEDQKLYKNLTLEELQEIERIIDKGNAR